MKKSAILGMVLVATMSFSAFAGPGAKGLFERVNEGRAPLQQALYGTEVVRDKDGKALKDKEGKDVVRAISLASLPESVRREKQDLLIKQLTPDKAREVREFLRSAENKNEEITRTEMLEQLLLTKNYVEVLKEGTEAKELASTVSAGIKLIANSTRAKDRGDEATSTLVQQSVNMLKWSSAQRQNVSKIIELQDKYMTEGMESRAALDRAYSEVKGVTLEVAKKAVDKIKELCKV